MILLRLTKEYSSFPTLPLHSQSDRGLCGIAAIRSVLETQFNQEASEDEVIRVIGRRRDWPKEEYKQRIRHQGTSPQDLAEYFKKKLPGVKVFCSRRGNTAGLETLLERYEIVPVLHQMVSYPENGDFKKDGHYLIYAGSREGLVRIFDPSRGKGFKFYSIPDFHRQWYNKGERWYLAVIPPEVSLDSTRYKGKYL